MGGKLEDRIGESADVEPRAESSAPELDPSTAGEAFAPALLAWLDRSFAARARRSGRGAELEVALLAELCGLPLRDQTFLRLHVVHAVGIATLARTYGVSEADVARRLLRCRAVLLEPLRRLWGPRRGSEGPPAGGREPSAPSHGSSNGFDTSDSDAVSLG